MNEYRQNKKIQKEKLREDFLTAISDNNIEQIKSLINQGAIINSNNELPLKSAVCTENIEIVKLLTQHRANPYLNNDIQSVLIEMYISYKCDDILYYLLEQENIHKDITLHAAKLNSKLNIIFFGHKNLYSYESPEMDYIRNACERYN